MNVPSQTEQLRALAAKAQSEKLQEFLGGLSSSEALHAFSRLTVDEQAQVLAVLTPDDAAHLLHEMPLALSAATVENLAPAVAAPILDCLPSDEQTDVLTHLEPHQAEAVLSYMAPDEAADVNRLRHYPSDTAGGLMVTEYLAYPHAARAAEVVHDLRTHAEQYAQFHVQYVYVVAPTGELLGVARLRDLMFLPDEAPLQAALLLQPATVRANAGLDDLKGFFEHYDFLAAPVVDEDNRLLGVVTRGDVEDAAVERAEQVFLRFSGIVAGEEFRTMPLRARVFGRLAWLGVTLLLNFVAASVVALFEDTLEEVIALAVFLPVISGMSGNAGNQAIAVTMRELTLGLVKPEELRWVAVKEAAVGVVNGLILGFILFLAAFLWKANPYLGLVVGCAQALSVLTAVCLGGTIPLMLKWLGFDPALASAPILTTVTDASGFFLALGLASWLLHLLV